MSYEAELMDVDVYDETDHAQWTDLRITAEAIHAERSKSRTLGMTPEQIEALIANSPIDCKECMDPIDARRRVLQPGVQYCTDCQEYLDRKKRVNGFNKH